MALAPIYVHSWNTKRPDNPFKDAYGHYFLMNTNRMVDITAYDETGDNDSKFWFYQAPDDSRCSGDAVFCTSSVSTLRTWHDTADASKFAILPVFPGFDLTEATVTTYIEWKDISHVYSTYQNYWNDNVCHVIYYENAFKRKHVIVDLSLIEVMIAEFTGLYL